MKGLLEGLGAVLAKLGNVENDPFRNGLLSMVIEAKTFGRISVDVQPLRR